MGDAIAVVAPGVRSVLAKLNLTTSAFSGENMPGAGACESTVELDPRWNSSRLPARASGTGPILVQIRTSPPNPLLAYYPFNGHANDDSGHGNDSTASGATLTTDRLGRLGRACTFNGTPNSDNRVPDAIGP